MSACRGPIYWRAGTDWSWRMLFRDQESQVPDSLAGLDARMQFSRADTREVLLTLTSGAGLSVEPSGETGRVYIELTAAQTRLLAPGNRRTELTYGIELFGSGTVPYSATGSMVMNPEAVNEP